MKNIDTCTLRDRCKLLRNRLLEWWLIGKHLSDFVAWMLNLYATRDVLLKADVDDSWIQTLHD